MRRVIAPIAAVALCAGMAAAHGAPKPQITDATGDYQVPSGDIVSGSLALSGPKRKTLTVKLDLVDAPSATAPHSYTVSFKVADCNFKAIYYGHPFGAVFSTSGVGCDDGSAAGNLPAGTVAVDGTSIVWSIPLAAPLKLKQKVTTLTALTEPGGMASGGPTQAIGDTANGTDWVIG
jgi:hypothetical protein